MYFFNDLGFIYITDMSYVVKYLQCSTILNIRLFILILNNHGTTVL